MVLERIARRLGRAHARLGLCVFVFACLALGALCAELVDPPSWLRDLWRPAAGARAADPFFHWIVVHCAGGRFEQVPGRPARVRAWGCEGDDGPGDIRPPGAPLDPDQRGGVNRMEWGVPPWPAAPPPVEEQPPTPAPPKQSAGVANLTQ